MTLEAPLKSALLFGLLALAGGLVGCFGPHGLLSLIGGLAATVGLIGAYRALKRLHQPAPHSATEDIA